MLLVSSKLCHIPLPVALKYSTEAIVSMIHFLKIRMCRHFGSLCFRRDPRNNTIIITARQSTMVLLRTATTSLISRSARLSYRFYHSRSTCYGISNPVSRCFGTTSKDDDDERQNKKKDTLAGVLADYGSRAVGQVIFLNDPRAGGLVLLSLALGSEYVALLAATGALVSNYTADQAGLDKAALSNGLWGYNGCLVGCATAVFVHPIVADASTMASLSVLAGGLATTATGAAASTLVAAALPKALGSVPQFTLAFNLVTLSMLLRTQPLLPSPGVVVEGAEAVVTAAAADVTIGQLMAAPLHGVSQIFVVESVLTGAGLLTAIASYSPQLAGHALMGSAVGCLTGVIMAAQDADIAMGLWGFNSALTSIVVGVFFKNTREAVTLSAGGAATTAVVFGAMQTVFGAVGAPCLTLPFCLTASGCYMLAGTVPGLTLAASPHSPEKN